MPATRRRGTCNGDVFTALRAATAADHERVEAALNLTEPGLTRTRLVAVLHRLHGFWLAAEAGLDGWAALEPDAAAAVGWHRRRRAALFAGDLRSLAADPCESAVPGLAAVPDTEEALGRMYVLEGSTLGGVLIDRHLAALPHLGVRLLAFSPYGDRTGAMWHAFRTATRQRVAAGAEAGRVVAGAQVTFAALAAWCEAAGGAARVPA